MRMVTQRMNTETAVRHIATRYPYDAHSGGQLALRDNAAVITAQLSAEIAAQVEAAGVRVIESRISCLVYAPEIAHAMLQRQQAEAVVEGPVGVDDLALARLAEDGVGDLDEERKAAVSNLLMVLCADRSTQPVINTGSLYQ